MNERERELLSALMDGEASEHEVLQALKATEGNAELAATWRRYHLAQSVLHGERDIHAGADLRGAVAGRLLMDAGQPAASALRGRLASLLKPLASVAVAASVAMVSVLAWQAYSTATTPAAGNALASVAPGEQRVALGPMVMVREDGEELVVPVADAASPTAAQDRLNAYLARHAQAAGSSSARGLAPYARVVSLDGEQAP